MNKIIMHGLAALIDDAQHKAKDALCEAALQCAPWDKGQPDLHRVYHKVIGQSLAPYLQATLTFAKNNGYGDLAEQYEDGIITSEEMLVKLVDNLAQEG